MILPDELKLDLPMTIAGGVVTTTMKVWEILVASRDGRLETVKRIVEDAGRSGTESSTPVTWAEKKGHHEIAEALRSKGRFP